MLDSFIDTDMVGDIDSRKSKLGNLIIFAIGEISWKFKLYKFIALSTIEDRYIFITKAFKEVLWMQNSYKN